MNDTVGQVSKGEEPNTALAFLGKSLLPTSSKRGGHQFTALAFRRFKFENETLKMLNKELNLMW